MRTSIEACEDPRAAAAPPASADRWQEIGRLSTSLFDLRGAYEANIRILTSMQRSLERVRRVDALRCEADLLLGEMARHVRLLDANRAELEESLAKAARCLDAVLGTEAPPARQE